MTEFGSTGHGWTAFLEAWSKFGASAQITAKDLMYGTVEKCGILFTEISHPLLRVQHMQLTNEWKNSEKERWIFIGF